MQWEILWDSLRYREQRARTIQHIIIIQYTVQNWAHLGLFGCNIVNHNIVEPIWVQRAWCPYAGWSSKCHGCDILWLPFVQSKRLSVWESLKWKARETVKVPPCLLGGHAKSCKHRRQHYNMAFECIAMQTLINGELVVGKLLCETKPLSLMRSIQTVVLFQPFNLRSFDIVWHLLRSSTDIDAKICNAIHRSFPHFDCCMRPIVYSAAQQRSCDLRAWWFSMIICYVHLRPALNRSLWNSFTASFAWFCGRVKTTLHSLSSQECVSSRDHGKKCKPSARAHESYHYDPLWSIMHLQKLPWNVAQDAHHFVAWDFRAGLKEQCQTCQTESLKVMGQLGKFQDTTSP